MRLPEFIRLKMEDILLEWESFAMTLLPSAENLSSLELRDHAAEILEAIALDVSTPQTTTAQTEKSKTPAGGVPSAQQTAAQTHAILREKSGFDINQVVAEYRAMRASVLRLWTPHCHSEPIHPDDVIRFNEAIDQALAESVQLFNEQVHRGRNLFLGMLAHDLRSPTNAINFIAQYLAKSNLGDAVQDAASSLIRCREAIKGLLNDLTDFNRTMLGVGIELKREDVDLAQLFAAEVDIQRHAHPTTPITLNVHGNVASRCDGVRLQQVLRNLISNAVQHGANGSIVTVELKGSDSLIIFEVCNRGEPIEVASYEEIFHPLRRRRSSLGKHLDARSLGLGLFIVREVVGGHGGTVEVRSTQDLTVFSVRLPRSAVGRISQAGTE